MKEKKFNLLLVANWDSGTKYAWWLMESFWLLLAQYYFDKGGTVYLAYPSVSEIPEKINESRIIVKQINFKKNDPVSVHKYNKFIRQNRINIIYFSDFPSCSLKYLIFHLIGVRYIIVHEHVPGVRSVPGKVKMWIKKSMHRLPWVCADGLIAATEYIRRRHIEVTGMPIERCYCAANGIPEKADVEPIDLHKKFGVPKHRLLMVTTGRASKYKGVDFALSVLAELINKQKRNNIHYLFCGDGPDLDSFKRTAKTLGVDSYVAFAGKVDNVFSYLVSCDFAIHPSKGEVGYSLSILEYMQAGLPVIVSDNPSVCNATIDGVNGYIYKENNLLDAADKVAQLLDDPTDISAKGACAKQQVLENYRLSDTHTQLLQAVKAITSQK